MTAEPTAGDVMWAPDPVRQRARAHSFEDLFNLPEHAPRVELHDGTFYAVGPPSARHQKINWRLVGWLDRHAPEGLEPQLAVGVAISLHRTLEPDVVLLRSPVFLDRHYNEAEQVVLAVEIVSPSTQERDRSEKPALFAAAGIPHFWRIEQDPVHVFAYDLVDGRYELVADTTDELVLGAPFEIKLPIAEITP
jgi:Uma2 family endonuclease